MKSICFFASYFTGEDLPYYITVYLEELKKYFSELVFLTSNKHLSPSAKAFLESQKINLCVQENKGFDFGHWYRAFQKWELDTYEKVALVNDSCILFRPLNDFMNWAKQSHADVKGMTRSEAIYPHLQSYFLILNQPAVNLTKTYFKKQGMLESISEVIRTYEVGLSKYLQEEGLSIVSFVHNDGYSGEFSPYYHCLDSHLKQGIPLIKKKIIYASYREAELKTLARMNFEINTDYYLNKLQQLNQPLSINLNKLRGLNEMNLFQQLKYNFRRRFIALMRPFYLALRPAPHK